jgi:hypothetical protein
MLEVFALVFILAKQPTVGMPALASVIKAASFQPAERAVSNWRIQAALDLDLETDTAVRWLAGTTPSNLPRCIRLNNYWCIKSAGWAGEIGTDSEGHVAFASAEEGAVAAILLLRRYYVDYGRKSARAIVARWAPAQCEPIASVTGTQGQPAATSLPPLAKYGIGNTLRARWLAAHGRGGGVKSRRGARKTAVRRSIVPDRLGPPMRTPTIALGTAAPEPPLVFEPPIRTETLRVASAASPPPARSRDAPLVPPAPLPVTGCAGDTLRLANYAAHAIEGIGRFSDEDLKLFDADGSPGASLPRLLANMAAIEIGPYRADAKLIDAAIEAVRKLPPRTAVAGE